MFNLMIFRNTFSFLPEVGIVSEILILSCTPVEMHQWDYA
jgi:hypothetical protein